MTDNHTLTDIVIEPRGDVARPREVDTPWGRMPIEEGMSFRREWRYSTGDATFPMAYGNVGVSMHVDGEEGQPHPRHARLVFHGGSESWGKPLGEPILKDGRTISWVAHVSIDPMSGVPLPDHPIHVSLSKADAPKEERRFLGIAPSMDDPELQARIASDIESLVHIWARESDYARVFYGAVAGIVEDENEEAVEQARLAYVLAIARRDEVRALAISAKSAGKALRAPDMPGMPHAAIVRVERDGGDMKNVRRIDLQAPARVTIELDGGTLSAMAVLHDGRQLNLLGNARENGILDGAMEIADPDQ